MTTEPTPPVPIVVSMLRWLVLSLLGWFVYALARALWAFVRLGAPLFDWQWYVAVIALLIVLSIRLALRWPRSPCAAIVVTGLLLWVVAGYSGFWQKLHLRPSDASPIPISFWARTEIVETPEAILHDLHKAGGVLYISVRPLSFDGENGDALLAGLQRLAEHDIDVYLAVVASDYLSVPVHDQWIANVRSIAATVQKEGLTNVRGLIGDAEHPKHTPLDILGRDRKDFYRAASNLDALVQFMADEYPKLDLGVTALWTLYFDGIDGDPDLSIIHRSSVEPPGNWAFINVMTYSSYLPPSWRAYHVYMVERTMARLYPELPPSHLIGLADQGWPDEPVLDFDDLVRDARLSRAMGVPEIVVFRLNDRALERFGDDFVGRLASAVNEAQPDEIVEVPFSRPASMLIYGAVFADALLDAANAKGWFLLFWIAASAFLVRYSTRDQGRIRSRR